MADVTARPRISIAIPAYNEIDTLERAVREALDVLPRHAEDYEVLIVDDGSADGTGALADRLAAENRQVRVVHHPANRGFSGAMRTCLWQSRGDLILMGPADGQARFQDLDILLPRIAEYDLLFGVRVSPWQGVVRSIGSRIWYAYVRLLFGVAIPEFAATFLFRRSAIQALTIGVSDRGANMLPALFVQAHARGFRVGTIETAVHPRTGGRAKGGRPWHILVTVAEDLRLCWRWRITKSF